MRKLFCDLCRAKKIQTEQDILAFAITFLGTLAKQKQVTFNRVTFQRGLEELVRDLKKSMLIIRYGQF